MNCNYNISAACCLVVLSLAGISGYVSAQDMPVFQHEVDSEKKPWTGTHFYNDPDNFQFLLVSDRSGGIRQGVFKKAVEKINLLYPEFVLSVGDLIQGYTMDTAQIRKEWAEVNAMIENLKMPFFYLPGNHDITNQVMAVEWEKRYGQRYYAFMYKNALFIILDSNDDDHHNLTREQTDFVLNTLGKHTEARWTFVLMHHPIWKYDTGGRFQEIEAAMAGRKHTVLAGHEHHYHYESRENANYYILATTGGGSRLRGKYFGEFDHVTWVTMTNEGPVFANLELDGIIPHDISNSETAAMARALLDNTNFAHVLLCNKGDAFTDGTLYFSFSNAAQYPLVVDLRFYHQHQLDVGTPAIAVTVQPGEDQIVEIPLSSNVPIDYDMVEAIQIDWNMRYEAEKFPDFQLAGNYDIEVKPTKTSFLRPQTTIFVDKITVSAAHPFSELHTSVSIDGNEAIPYRQPVQLASTGSVAMHIENQRGQSTATETTAFVRTEPHKAVRVRNPKEGVRYAYFEGPWKEIPDFEDMRPVARGIAQDWGVGDVALRKDHFGIMYSGYFYAEKEGVYTFRARADDACRLTIAGKVIADQELGSGKSEDTGSVALSQGYHPFTIYFVEQEGNERFRLYVQESDEESWNYLDVNKNFFH
jgi:hypothetical protein